MYLQHNYHRPLEGWRCPVCGRVYSPTTSMCFFCNGNDTILIGDYPNSPYIPSADWTYRPTDDFTTICDSASGADGADVYAVSDYTGHSRLL